MMLADTFVAARVVVLKAGARAAKRVGLSGILGIQVGIVAFVITDSRGSVNFQVPILERSSLELFPRANAALHP